MNWQHIKHLTIIAILIGVVPIVILALFRKRIFGIILKPEQEKYISGLHKKFKFKFERLIERIEKETDYNVIITSCYRTFSEQQKQHEADPRNNPKPGGSMHNYGMACFDSETEILTESGWSLFKDLDRKEKVMVFKDDKIFYEIPTSYVSYPYKGEMIHVKTRSVDLLTTPNHKFIVKKYNTPIIKGVRKYYWDKDWGVELAENLTHSHKIPTSGEYDGPTKIEYPFSDNCSAETWWEFMGFYLSEGSSCGVSDGIKRTHNLRYSVRISQYTKGKAYNHIKSCLDRLGLYYSYRGHDFIIHSKKLWEILFPLGNCHQKRISRYLLNAPKELLQILFNAMIMGDGSTYASHFAYFTVNKKLADDFCELSIKLGRSCILTYRNRKAQMMPQGKLIKTLNTQYAVLSRSRKTQELRNGDNSKNIHKIPYDGMVYCVETNAGAVVIRRNGRISVCGNCDINAVSGTNYLRKASSKEAWEKSGIPQIAREMGFTWGGDFKSYHDPVHIGLDDSYDVDYLKQLAINEFGTDWDNIRGNEINLA